MIAARHCHPTPPSQPCRVLPCFGNMCCEVINRHSKRPPLLIFTGIIVHIVGRHCPEPRSVRKYVKELPVLVYHTPVCVSFRPEICIRNFSPREPFRTMRFHLLVIPWQNAVRVFKCYYRNMRPFEADWVPVFLSTSKISLSPFSHHSLSCFIR